MNANPIEDLNVFLIEAPAAVVFFLMRDVLRHGMGRGWLTLIAAHHPAKRRRKAAFESAMRSWPSIRA
jgi:hypothetical protein